MSNTNRDEPVAIGHKLVEIGHEVSLNTEFDPESRCSKIRAVVAIAKSARDDATQLDLKFEAYLLDMAVIALSEQLQKDAQKTD